MFCIDRRGHFVYDKLSFDGQELVSERLAQRSGHVAEWPGHEAPSWHSTGRRRHCTWRVLPKAQQARQAFKAATGPESRVCEAASNRAPRWSGWSS